MSTYTLFAMQSRAFRSLHASHINRLRLESGQQPLSSLLSMLEEKSAEYVSSLIINPPSLRLFRYTRTPYNASPTYCTFPYSSVYAVPMLPQ